MDFWLNLCCDSMSL